MPRCGTRCFAVLGKDEVERAITFANEPLLDEGLGGPDPDYLRDRGGSMSEVKVLYANATLAMMAPMASSPLVRADDPRRGVRFAEGRTSADQRTPCYLRAAEGAPVSIGPSRR